MPQELNTKMMEPLTDKNQVRPFETVKVYATSKSGFHAEGEELEVHPLLAAKLIAKGSATEKKITKKEKDA